MGFLRFFVKALIQGIFIFLLISFMPGLPPHVLFTEFKVTEPTSLEGTLSVNTLLNDAEHLFSGKLHGPEAFVDFDGVLYTSIHGGEIVKFVDGKIVPVSKFGERCGGFWDEKNCGRPLGMNFGSDGYLYVADAYSGIYKVNINTGTKTQLVSIDDVIEDKMSKLPNSVDVAADGTVYWTTSSTNFYLQDGVFDALADGSGRLIRYDPRTKKNEVLIEGLHFANGVVLSPNEEFVLVAETFRSRIHRYYLKGPKKGERDVFIDGLPGLPDNLKSDGQGGFFVPLVLIRDKNNPVLFQSLGPFPMLRKFVSRIFALLEMGFEQIEKVYPNNVSKRAIHWLGHFESVRGVSPKGFILLQLDINGNVKHSFHNTDNTLSGISEAHWFNGAFYFGSPYNTYVGRVKLSFAEPEKKQEEYISKEEPQIQKQQAPSQQSGKPSPSPQQQEKPSPPPQQREKPSPPPQQREKLSLPPQQPEKPSPPPQQPEKPSPPPQQPEKPSPPPQQPEKPLPPSQQPEKPSPPPQQPEKPSSPSQQQPQKPSPQQQEKPSSPPQQQQKPSPSPQQPQKPSPSHQEPQKSSPPQQPQKPSPPLQQPQNLSPPPQQPQKPSPPPQKPSPPSQKPSPLSQKPSPPPQKPSPPPQQPQKPSPPPQQPQNPSSTQQQTQQKQPNTPTSEQQKSSQAQQQRSSSNGVKP